MKKEGRKLLAFNYFETAEQLHEVSKGLLSVSVIWMGLAYFVWLVLRNEYGEHDFKSLLALAIGFGPWLLKAFLDYRTGMILTIVATPFFVAPSIPHWFTQGFGDLFAFTTVVGCLFSHRRKVILKLFSCMRRKNYIWIALLWLSGVLSLVAQLTEGNITESGVRYALSELAGIGLAFGFMAALVDEVSSEKDLARIYWGFGLSLIAVLAYGVVSAGFTLRCVGGYYGSSLLSPNQGIAASFLTPNSFVSYAVVALPFVMALYFACREPKRSAALMCMLLLIYMVEASLSRAGLVALAVQLVGFVAITRWRKSTRVVTVTYIGLLFFTFVVWWYPACMCDDAPPWACAPWYVAKQELGIDTNDEEALKNSIFQSFPAARDGRGTVHTQGSAWRYEKKSKSGVKRLSADQSAQRIDQRFHESLPKNEDSSRRVTAKLAKEIGMLDFAQGIIKGAAETRIIPKGAIDNTRIALIREAYSIWREHWLFGVGIGQLDRHIAIGQYNYKAHNVYLTILAEQGLIGGIAWIGWLAGLSLVVWRFRRDLTDLRHAAPFLMLSFIGVCVMSLFIDHLRAIWLWQLFASMLATDKVGGFRSVSHAGYDSRPILKKVPIFKRT